MIPPKKLVQRLEAKKLGSFIKTQIIGTDYDFSKLRIQKSIIKMSERVP